MPKTDDNGYKYDTICEKPNSLIKKGKNTEKQIATVSFLKKFKKLCLSVKHKERSVVKQLIKMTT